MKPRQEITNEQWAVIEPLIPKRGRRSDGRGRPPREERAIVEGILWVLRTGAPWMDLPDRYPSYSTCYRRFREWMRRGVLREILESLAQHLQDAGEIDMDECFVDATFIGAKKGVPKSVKLAAARAPSSWQWRTAMVFQSRFTHEVLRQLKSPLFTKLSGKVFLPSLHTGSLQTALTTVINLFESLPKKESS